MQVYLDEQYMAHTEQDAEGSRIPWNDAQGAFTAKCPAFIAGHRVVPEGAMWEREDGETFTGLMVTPVVNPAALQALQANADSETIAALDTAVVDLTYQNILLEIGV